MAPVQEPAPVQAREQARAGAEPGPVDVLACVGSCMRQAELAVRRDAGLDTLDGREAGSAVPFCEHNYLG